MFGCTKRSRRIALRRSEIAVALAIVLALTNLAPAAASGLQLLNVRVNEHPRGLDLDFVATGPITADVSVLRFPDRLRVTIPKVKLIEGAPTIIPVERGEVRRIWFVESEDAEAGLVAFIYLSAPVTYDLSYTAPHIARIRIGVPLTPAGTNGTVRLAVQQAPIGEVLSAIAKACGTQIALLDGSSKGTITVTFDDLSCDAAWDVVLMLTKMRARRIGGLLVIGPAEALPEAAVMEVYQLQTSNPDQVAKQLQAMIKDVRVHTQQDTNTLLIIGTVEQHHQVRRALPALDVAAPQVLLEAQVVDVSMNILRDLGLSWGVGSSGSGGSGGIKITIGDTVIVGRISALVTEGKARVVAAPRVLTQSGQKATITLGEDLPIPQRDAEGGVTYTFKRVGVGLEITPRANRDGTVTAELTVKVESVLEMLATPSGPVPRVATREIKANVRVENGQTIVLGGLISREERVSVLKIPLLGDLPVVGSLFRLTTRSARDSEIVFMLTPKVLPSALATGGR